MVQPYLGQPNYMGAMSSGLSARLAYLNRRRGGGVRVGGGNGMAPDREAGAPFSPERRAEYRNLMQEETARDVALEQAETGIAKTEAGIAETKKRTEQMGVVSELDKEGKRLSQKAIKAKTEKLEADRVKTIFDSISTFAPALTKDTIPDFVNWVYDETNVDLGRDKEWTDVEAKVFQSQIAAGSDYTKNVKAATKAKEKEAADFKKAKGVARKEYVRIQGVIDKAENTGGFGPEIVAMLSPDAQARLAGADRTEYVGVLEEYGQQLMEEYGFDVTPRKPKPTGNVLDTETARGFLKQAGGDKTEARRLATEAGYTL